MTLDDRPIGSRGTQLHQPRGEQKTRTLRHRVYPYLWETDRTCHVTSHKAMSQHQIKAPQIRQASGVGSIHGISGRINPKSIKDQSQLINHQDHEKNTGDQAPET